MRLLCTQLSPALCCSRVCGTAPRSRCSLQLQSGPATRLPAVLRRPQAAALSITCGYIDSMHLRNNGRRYYAPVYIRYIYGCCTSWRVEACPFIQAIATTRYIQCTAFARERQHGDRISLDNCTTICLRCGRIRDQAKTIGMSKYRSGFKPARPADGVSGG